MTRIEQNPTTGKSKGKIKKRHPALWLALEALIRQGNKGLTVDDGSTGNYGIKTHCLNSYVSTLRNKHNVSIISTSEKKPHPDAEPYVRYAIPNDGLGEAIKIANWQRIKRNDQPLFNEVV